MSSSSSPHYFHQDNDADDEHPSGILPTATSIETSLSPDRMMQMQAQASSSLPSPPPCTNNDTAAVIVKAASKDDQEEAVDLVYNPAAPRVQRSYSRWIWGLVALALVAAGAAVGAVMATAASSGSSSKSTPTSPNSSGSGGGQGSTTTTTTTTPPPNAAGGDGASSASPSSSGTNTKQPLHPGGAAGDGSQLDYSPPQGGPTTTPTPPQGQGSSSSPGSPSSPGEISETEQVLRSFSRNSGVEFDDANSYQSKALQWLLNSSPPDDDNDAADESLHATEAAAAHSGGSGISKLDRVLQRFALACIYYATYQVRNEYTTKFWGPDTIYGWNNPTGWLEADADAADDECTWHGVTCDHNGRVSELNLDTNGLTGTFPHEVVYLAKSLQVLQLGGNFCHNQLDDGLDFLAQLTSLRILRNRNGLFQYHGLPPQLAHLTALEELDLSYNVLYGSLEESAANLLATAQALQTVDGDGNEVLLPKLVYLEVSGNTLHGTIPPRLFDSLPSLQYLYMANLDIGGDLSFLPHLNNPIEVWMDDNDALSGTLADAAVLDTTDVTGGGPQLQMPNTLQSFSFTKCNVTGPIDGHLLGQLTNMKQMWFSDNRLTGTIPTQLGLLTALETFHVDGNVDLTGEMPFEAVCRGIHRPFGRLSNLRADCHMECSCCDSCRDKDESTRRRRWLRQGRQQELEQQQQQQVLERKPWME